MIRRLPRSLVTTAAASAAAVLLSVGFVAAHGGSPPLLVAPDPVNPGGSSGWERSLSGPVVTARPVTGPGIPGDVAPDAGQMGAIAGLLMLGAGVLAAGAVFAAGLRRRRRARPRG